MISSVLFGLSLYKKYKMRPNSLALFINLLNCYLLELKWKRKSFVDVIKQNKENNKYLNTVATLIPFNSLTDSAIKCNNEFENLFLDAKDTEILEYFFENTGRGNLESEISLCQNTVRLLQIKKEEADNTLKKMGPLSLKLCIIFAVWIAIILL